MPLLGQEHVDRYLATDGEEGHDWQGTQTLLLTTTGRRSGQQRQLPLIYGRHGEDYLVVGSKGGAPQPPAWYLNLEANPDVEIQVKGDKMRARARTATPEEKPELWSIMTREWPDYDGYQEKTDREIPVIVLEPTFRNHGRWRWPKRKEPRVKIAVIDRGNVGGGLGDLWRGPVMTSLGSGRRGRRLRCGRGAGGGPGSSNRRCARQCPGPRRQDGDRRHEPDREPPSGFASNAEFIKSKTDGPTVKSFNPNFASQYGKLGEAKSRPTG